MIMDIWKELQDEGIDKALCDKCVEAEKNADQ